MPKAELIYDDDCPNVDQARAQLASALVASGLDPRWREWRADDPAAPAYARAYGSPTILIGEVDVAGAEPGAAACCRLYEHPDGSVHGVPSVEMIQRALAAAPPPTARRSSPGGGWKLNAAVFPGVAAALLPKVTCPACWPAYAGVLSALGLGFLLETKYMLPLTATFLGVAVGALAFRARGRRGYAPFALGLAAAAVALIGKFGFDSDPAMYGGLALLVAASLWNSWPRRATPSSCPSCVGGPEPTCNQERV